MEPRPSLAERRGSLARLLARWLHVDQDAGRRQLFKSRSPSANAPSGAPTRMCPTPENKWCVTRTTRTQLGAIPLARSDLSCPSSTLKGLFHFSLGAALTLMQKTSTPTSFFEVNLHQNNRRRPFLTFWARSGSDKPRPTRGSGGQTGRERERETARFKVELQRFSLCMTHAYSHLRTTDI